MRRGPVKDGGLDSDGGVIGDDCGDMKNWLWFILNIMDNDCPEVDYDADCDIDRYGDVVSMKMII